MSPHVLVADDDAWLLRMVTTVLEKRGYTVEVAGDGEEAIARALARLPDLLITDVMMPRMDGWTLVKTLRSRPELAQLPVIFLSAMCSDEDRIRGFRLGADDFLPKPFRFEELDLRVAKTLRRARAMLRDTRDRLEKASLRGDLSQVGLSALLVLIDLERKTGLLSLRSGDGQSGQIVVREGRVIHARIDGRDHPVDIEAVYQLLAWSSGDFDFLGRSVEGPDRIGRSTNYLLLEAARIIDESRRTEMAM